MGDYKAAKEAFVADNPGTSVHYINAVSATALSAYALYAAVSRRHASPVVDWATIVVPLLLGVTVFAASPVLFNAGLVAAVLLLGVGTPRGKRASGRRKPKGQWLNESDSEDGDDDGDLDDRDYEHTRKTGRHINGGVVKLPSELVAEEAKRRGGDASAKSASSTSVSSLSSPNNLRIEANVPRRRASPSPVVTGEHTIDIAASPPQSPETDLGHFARAQTRVLKEKAAVPPPAPTKRTHLPFLTVYRAHMMIMTVHCILAVDFPIFPRVLGKCEDFGTSLMDVGVGSFVFSLGIVSSKSFSPSKHANTPWVRTCLMALRKAAPVLALGFVRLMMVKGVEYPEHLTEYGVHWNFFFTLGLIPALCSALLPLRRQVRWHVLAVAIMLVHQCLLSGTPLQAFLLSASRPGLLGMNKEGLASVPGYLAIFMLGLSAGERVLRAASTDEVEDGESGRQRPVSADVARDRANKRRTELALELAGYAALAWAALGTSHILGLQVSRRFANLPYVLWTVAYNASYLAGYLGLELFIYDAGDPASCPPLLQAVNKNSLVVFLVANLLTGLVNVSTETMYTGTSKAMLILTAYSAATCAFAWAIRKYRIAL